MSLFHRITVILFFTAVLLVQGCMNREMYRPSFVSQDEEWIRLVTDYRKESARNPESQEMKASLKRVEFDASEFFYLQAMELNAVKKYDEAIMSLQKGLAVMPGNEKVSNAFAELTAMKEAHELARRAREMIAAGNSETARDLVSKALEYRPEDPELVKLAEELEPEPGNEKVFTSDKKITIKFSGSDVKSVFDFIGKAYDINIIYDEGVKNLPVSVTAADVTLEQALETVAASAGVFYKKIGGASMLVVQDIKAKRDQYEDLIIRTYQLNVIKASEMANILKSTLGLKRITANDSLNSVSVRDTEDVLKLAGKIIRANDRKPAEVIFDVEIMEVNRTKAEQLGLNYGSQIKLTLPSFATAGQALSTSFIDMLRQGAMTLPAFTLNFFKQDVDAKMLANPRVRVVEGKKARIHIGDRVPMRSSIIQDATGQVRYTYEYRDIGVMLEVTPKINLDNSVFVALRLQVSTLGSNIGTASDPAYSIGTRDADTTMLLKDGETAILGGLIRDEERKNMLKIPLLGDIPVIGSIFTVSNDMSGSRTDVMLTITPRIVRSWEYIGKEMRDIYSGTENHLSSRPKYGSGKKDDGPQKGAVTVDITGSKAGKEAVIEGLVQSFSEPQYVIMNATEGTAVLTAENFSGIKNLPYRIAFNNEVVGFAGAEKSAGGAAESIAVFDDKAAEGVIVISAQIRPEQGGAGAAEIANVRFSAKKPGVSYLVLLEEAVSDGDGKPVIPQRKASRLVVK